MLVIRKNRVFISYPLLFAILGLIGSEVLLADNQRSTNNDERDNIVHYTTIPEFTVIGIATRTSNAKESGGDGVIPQQWQKFFSEGIPAKINDKISPNFYAVYADYASDHNGDYTYVVGVSVKDGTVPPDGLIVKRIPAGKYAVFTTGKGPFAKIVPETWQKINTLADEGKLKRAYQADFESYDQRAHDPQNAQVDIYVGVK